MTPQSLFLLALFGVLVASPVLVYVFRARTDRYHRLAWVTTFLALDLILFGAFTRLTDSGLGCPDWPGCYGHSNPVSAGEHIAAAETAMPTGPVTRLKAWIEMLHRYFAMGVGLLIIVLMVWAWRRRQADAHAPSPWLATAIFLAVCVQGAFGAFTVTLKLQPVIVTLHLLGGMTLLGLLTWLALRESPARPVAAGQGLRPHVVLAILVLAAQIALGGWVSSNYAVMACPDFPLCHGQWIPATMDFRHAFTLWRPLGLTADGDLIPFQSLVAIHWVHRSFAWLVFGLLGWLAWRASRFPGLRRWARGLGLLLALQLLTGLSNVLLAWPLPLALLHNAGAALLVMMLVVLNFRLVQARADGPRQR